MKYMMTVIIITFYFSFTIAFIVTMVLKSAANGEKFLEQDDTLEVILTINVYIYSTLIILMLIVNIDLIRQLQKVQR